MTEDPTDPHSAVVLVAAGNSTRMGSTDPARPRKPWFELAGVPMIERTLEAFNRCPAVREVVLVAHEDDVEAYQRACASNSAYRKVVVVVAGGAQRADSVRRGVFWCSYEARVIAVHDAARPLVRPAQIEHTLGLAAARGAALLAVPASDTIKVSTDGSAVENTLDRSVLFCAQTPQAFDARRFRELVLRADADGESPTDDAALWERYVGPVAIAPGTSRNFKVTTPDDVRLASALFASDPDEELA